MHTVILDDKEYLIQTFLTVSCTIEEIYNTNKKV